MSKQKNAFWDCNSFIIVMVFFLTLNLFAENKPPSIQAVAPGDPEWDAGYVWDWEADIVNDTRFTLYVINNPPVPIPNISLPWKLSGSRLYEWSCNNPEQYTKSAGWVCLWRDFGTINRPISPAQMVFYNKYSGILRLIWFNDGYTYNHAKVTLHTDYPIPFFAFMDSEFCSDFTCNERTVDVAMPNNNWCFADFVISGYVPHPPADSHLFFEIWGATSQILNGEITGNLNLTQVVQEEDATSNTAEQLTNLYEWGDKTVKSFQNTNKMIDDLIKHTNSTGDWRTKDNGYYRKESELIYSICNTTLIKDIVPGLGVALNLLSLLSGGSSNSPALKFHGEIDCDVYATIEGQEDLGGVTLRVPGASRTNDDYRPYYDTPLGLFNLTTKPSLNILNMDDKFGVIFDWQDVDYYIGGLHNYIYNTHIFSGINIKASVLEDGKDISDYQALNVFNKTIGYNIFDNLIFNDNGVIAGSNKWLIGIIAQLYPKTGGETVTVGNSFLPEITYDFYQFPLASFLSNDINELPFTGYGSLCLGVDYWDVQGDDGGDISYRLILEDTKTLDISLCSPKTEISGRMEIFYGDPNGVLGPISTGYYSNCSDCFYGSQIPELHVTLAPGSYWIVIDSGIPTAVFESLDLEDIPAYNYELNVQESEFPTVPKPTITGIDGSNISELIIRFTKIDEIDKYRLNWQFDHDNDGIVEKRSVEIDLASLVPHQWHKVDYFDGELGGSHGKADCIFIEAAIDKGDGTYSLIVSLPPIPVFWAKFCFQMAAVDMYGHMSQLSKQYCKWLDPPLPYLAAGKNQLVVSNDFTATLHGTAYMAHEDGSRSNLPVVWSKEDGPGTVSFSNSTDTLTQATFSESGLYELSLDDLDSDTYIKDETKVMIFPDSAFADWEPMYQDDFSGSRTDGLEFGGNANWWVTSDSSFEALSIIQDRFLKGEYGGPGAYALIDSAFFKDFKLTLDARISDSYVNYYSDFGIIFGYKTDNYYYFLDFMNMYGKSGLYISDFGELRKLADISKYVVQDNKYHHIELLRKDGYISVKYDEQVVLLHEDSRIGKGQIGFGSFDNGAAFANVTVETDSVYPKEPPAVLSHFNENNALGWTPLTPSRWSIVEIEDGYYQWVTSTERVNFISPAYALTINDPASGEGDRFEEGYEPLQEYSLVSDKIFQNFELNCRAKTAVEPYADGTLPWWTDFAVVFGYQGPNDYYYFEFTRAWQSSALIKVVNGTCSILGRPEIEVLKNDSYHDLRVRRVNSNISVSFDGKELVNVEDSTFATGQVGVGSYNNHCIFDNIIVDAGEYTVAPDAPLVFSDSFDSLNTEAWSFSDSTYWGIQAQDGDSALVITNPNYQPGFPGKYALIDTLSFGDFHFKCRAKILGEPQTSVSRYGFIFGYQNENNYYFMDFNYANDTQTKLYKVVAGVFSVVKQADYSYLYDASYHRIEIIREGSCITVKSGGTTVLFLSDDTFGSGKIGVGCISKQAAFDDVQVFSDDVISIGDLPANLFTDDFEDGDASGWTEKTASRWNVTESEGNHAYSIITTDYTAQYPSIYHVGEYSLIDSLEYSDFTFKCKARCDDDLSAYQKDYVVMFGYTAWNTYYWMRFSSQGADCAILKSTNGTIAPLATCSEALVTDNNYHDIMILRFDDKIRVYLDNKKIVDITETAYINGQIGVGSQNDMASFDDIYITSDVELPDPLSDFSDDFEGTVLDAWTEKTSSRWAIQEENGNHVYSVITSGFTIQYPWPTAMSEYSTIDDREYTDFVFSLDARSDMPNLTLWDMNYGVLFGMTAWDHYYAMRFSNRLQTCFLYKVNGCTAPQTLANSSSILLTDHNFHHVDIVNLGDSLSVYFDSLKVLTYVHESEITGQMGIGTHGCKVSYDNVHVTANASGLGKALLETTNALPKTFDLSQNYPNPFNPDTHIKYQLPEQGDVKLVIYDIMGRMVRKLVDQRNEPGFFDIVWDGKNQSGVKVATGIYIYRIHVDGVSKKFEKTKKMMLLK